MYALCKFAHKFMRKHLSTLSTILVQLATELMCSFMFYAAITSRSFTCVAEAKHLCKWRAY